MTQELQSDAQSDAEPGADEEEYRPRDHDHLVEPVFGGLGVGSPDSEAAEQERAAWHVRLWHRLARLFNRDEEPR